MRLQKTVVDGWLLLYMCSGQPRAQEPLPCPDHPRLTPLALETGHTSAPKWIISFYYAYSLLQRTPSQTSLKVSER